MCGQCNTRPTVTFLSVQHQPVPHYTDSSPIIYVNLPSSDQWGLTNMGAAGLVCLGSGLLLHQLLRHPYIFSWLWKTPTVWHDASSHMNMQLLFWNQNFELNANNSSLPVGWCGLCSNNPDRNMCIACSQYAQKRLNARCSLTGVTRELKLLEYQSLSVTLVSVMLDTDPRTSQAWGSDQAPVWTASPCDSSIDDIVLLSMHTYNATNIWPVNIKDGKQLPWKQ